METGSPERLIIENELAGMNDCKLKQQFKAQVCFTRFKSLTEMRLTNAKKGLEESRLSIADIVSRVGYSYSQHFATAF